MSESMREVDLNRHRLPARRKSSGGRSFGGFVAGLLFASKHGVTPDKAAVWVRDRVGDAVAAKALSTTGASTGGALVPQQFTDEIIDLLRARAVVRRAGPRFYDMPGGNLTIPRAINTSAAFYLGELDDIAASQPTYDDLQLNAKKLTVLASVSNDLIRRAPIDIEEVIRDDFVETMALREDVAFLTGDGSLGSPIGLLNHVPVGNSIVATPLTGMTNDQIVTTAVGLLNGMRLILKTSMSRMLRPTWIGTPGTFEFFRTLRDDFGGFLFEQQMDRGVLLNFPFLETQQIPSNLLAPYGSGSAPVGSQLFLVDFADVILAETMSIKIDLSDSATYQDAAGTSVSAFTRDQTAYRAIVEHDFGVRHPGSIAVALLPSWLPPGVFSYASASAFFRQAASGDGSAAASTWGMGPTGGNNPGTNSANAPGGVQPGRG